MLVQEMVDIVERYYGNSIMKEIERESGSGEESLGLHLVYSRILNCIT